MGIDGRFFPVGTEPKAYKDDELALQDRWYPIQVKQKDKAGTPDIRDFEGVMTMHDRKKGFFISFDYSGDAMTEASQFFKKTGKMIIPLTVQEILDEHIAHKLA